MVTQELDIQVLFRPVLDSVEILLPLLIIVNSTDQLFTTDWVVHEPGSIVIGINVAESIFATILSVGAPLLVVSVIVVHVEISARVICVDPVSDTIVGMIITVSGTKISVSDIMVPVSTTGIGSVVPVITIGSIDPDDTMIVSGTAVPVDTETESV
jgi:hypothetical protein